MSGCDFTLGGTNRCKGTTVWEMVSNQARNLCLSQLEVEFSQHRWCIFCRVPLISVLFFLHLLSTRTVKWCVTEHTLLFPLSLSMCTHKCNTMRNASFLSVQSIYKNTFAIICGRWTCLIQAYPLIWKSWDIIYLCLLHRTQWIDQRNKTWDPCLNQSHLCK